MLLQHREGVASHQGDADAVGQGPARPGVEQPPIEPGRRCTACAPCAAPWPRKPCRFMVPAQPLPLDVPVT